MLNVFISPNSEDAEYVKASLVKVAELVMLQVNFLDKWDFATII